MITEKDLIGSIKGFPIEVVEKMLERQEEQSRAKDVAVFQNYASAGYSTNGFTWSETAEGHDFWESVIKSKNFDRFFSKYPQRKETNTISINKSTKVKLNFKL